MLIQCDDLWLVFFPTTLSATVALLLLHSALTPSKYAFTTPSCLNLSLAIIALDFSISKNLYFSYHKILNVLRSSKLHSHVKLKCIYFLTINLSFLPDFVTSLLNYLYSPLLKIIFIIHDSPSMPRNTDTDFGDQWSRKCIYFSPSDMYSCHN